MQEILVDGGASGELVLSRGVMGDYHALSEHHYLAGRPATVTRIFSLYDRSPSSVDRYLKRQARDKVVAVLVESMPVINSRLRDEALGGRYRRWTNARDRARVVNEEIRTISRVIVDPQYRSLGLAVRLIRHLLERPGARCTEAIAAMGQVHPMFVKAGMTEYVGSPGVEDERLLEVFSKVGFGNDVESVAGVRVEDIKGLSGEAGEWFVAEMRKWYQGRLRHRADKRAGVEELLREVKRKVFCQARYYWVKHR